MTKFIFLLLFSGNALAAGSAAPTPAAPAKAVVATPTAKFVEGSIFSVYPLNSKSLKQPLDAAGAFIFTGNAPYTIAKYKDQEALNWIDSQNIGAGISGWLKATSAGRYSISAKLELASIKDKSLTAYARDIDLDLNCVYELEIEGKSILKNAITVLKVGGKYDTQKVTKKDIQTNGIELSAGWYKTHQWLACSNSGTTKTDTINATVSLRIKQPNDLLAKEIGGSDLYYRKK
jgi:hypothetical protein